MAISKDKSSIFRPSEIVFKKYIEKDVELHFSLQSTISCYWLVGNSSHVIAVWVNIWTIIKLNSSSCECSIYSLGSPPCNLLNRDGLGLYIGRECYS